MNQPLRAIADSVAVLSAIEIPRVGFGHTEVTRRLAAGALITEVVERTFRMSCGCHIRKHDECGAACLCCRSELEQGLDPVVLVGLSMVEFDFLATPCKEHYMRCSYPFCPSGTCVRHCAQAPDGKYYCPPHFQEVADAVAFAELESQRGFVLARASRFMRSLFFDNQGSSR